MPGWMKWTIALLVGFGLVVIGWKLTDSRIFFWVLPAFFIVNCLVLIIVVLLQSGKAADLAGAFGGAGSQTAFGPRGAANVLSTATTWCAIMFMLCAMALVLRSDKAVGQSGSVLENVSKPAPKPVPATPSKAPVTTPVTPPSSSQPPSSTPAARPPAQQAPATSQPAPAPAKKP
jgi:preprotein translocase subunit SecG